MAGRHLEHLPPGVRPGPQSRRRQMNIRTGGCIAPFLVLGAVFSLVLSGGLAQLPSPDGADYRGGPDPAWFWLAGIGGAAFFLAGAFFFWRQAYPRRDSTLEVRLDRNRARRGDELCATVVGVPARADIEVTLACHVHWDRFRASGGEDRPSTDRVIAKAVAWKETTQASPSGEARLRLPAEQPYSHEGSVISFAWLVSARTVVHGKHGRTSLPAAVWVDP